MELQESIRSLCQALQADVPEADARGRYVLRFEDELELRCFLLVGKPMLEGVICRAPAEPAEAEALFKKLLRVSLARARDRADTLTLDQEAGEVLLVRRLAVESGGGREFVGAVEDFLNQLDFWHRQTTKDVSPRSPFSMFARP